MGSAKELNVMPANSNLIFYIVFINMKNAFLCLTAWLITFATFGQKEKLNTIVAAFPVNYEDSLAGTYILPDLFTLRNGKFIPINHWMDLHYRMFQAPVKKESRWLT